MDCNECKHEGECGYLPKLPACSRCKNEYKSFEFCEGCVGLDVTNKCKFELKEIKVMK